MGLMSTLQSIRNSFSSAIAGPPALYSHPAYVDQAAVWRLLAHAYLGSGGFRDGTYLIAHPREFLDHQSPNPSRPSPKLLARRTLARYENMAAQIVDQKCAALFRNPPTRQVNDLSDRTPHPIRKWWNDVDGAGCQIDDYIADAWLVAAVFGHVVILPTREREKTPPMTFADQSMPYCSLYTPLDIPDWTVNERGTQLTGLRLLEPVPRASIEDPLPSLGVTRSRIITLTGWELAEGGQRIDRGSWNFDKLPAVYLFAKGNPLIPWMGQSVLGDPKLFVDDYNLSSEIRELLRAQVFGHLNVPLGPDGKFTFDQARQMLGPEAGTSNVLFTPLPASFISPSGENVVSYQEERRQLQRKILRLCSLPFDSDSKDAESEGSLKLKREDMNQIVAAYADQCEKADYQLAEWWFRLTYGPERWRAEWDAANVMIRYPDSFDVTPFETILEQAQAAVSLEMPHTFMVELKKRLVGQFLPDAPQDVVDAINNELIAEPTRAQRTIFRSLANTAAA
jgi:hypothetical protein